VAIGRRKVEDKIGSAEETTMLYVVLIVMVIVLGSLLVWGARKSKGADEDIKYMNEGRGPGRGILGVFGKGSNDRRS
jgi:hypothetical protein